MRSAVRTPRPSLPPRRTGRVAIAVPVILALGACVAIAGCDGAAGGTASPAATTSGSAASPRPSLTPVPGGGSTVPDPAPTRIPTTQTEWGEILDALPPTFPMHPDADVADVEGGPLSGILAVAAESATIAAWYAEGLAARSHGVEVSGPFEDGSLVLDAQADLPECRIRMTFRPEDGSTIITVLVAAACVDGTEG